MSAAGARTRALMNVERAAAQFSGTRSAVEGVAAKAEMELNRSPPAGGNKLAVAAATDASASAMLLWLIYACSNARALWARVPSSKKQIVFPPCNKIRIYLSVPANF